MPSLTVNMVKDRETKGAVRYQEIDADGRVVEDIHNAYIGTLYLRKSALQPLGPSIPVGITVTVEW